jgi:hypothetical protein
VPLFSCRNLNTSITFVNRAIDNYDRAFDYPQWGATLNAFMDAAADAET